MKQSADLLITNANVLTLDNDNTRASSLAVKDGRIIALWLETDPVRDEVIISDQTKVMDLDGATLIPGFIDTHNHILAYAQMAGYVNCSTPPNNNVADVLQAIDEKSKKTEKGKWISGYGYDDTLLEESRHITRNDLDTVTPDHPVFITHISGHLAVANTKAMEIAGVSESVMDTQGGQFGRDDNGKLNGVLYEKFAMAPFYKVIPDPTKEKMVELLGIAAQDYLAQGITMNTDAAVGMSGDPQKELDVHIEAALQGVNPMRTRLMVMHNLLQKGEVFGDDTAEVLDWKLSDASNGRVRLDGAKLFQDGSLQGLTGALREPYYSDINKKGQLFHDQGALNEEMLDLHRRGFRIAIHGNGDNAIGSILDGYSHVLASALRKNHRHRIEHVQTATQGDIKRMEELDVAGSFFINHVYYWGDRHEKIFLGPKRAHRISPLREAVDQQLLFTLHSDCPITPISPLFSVWAAVNRLTSDGKILGPQQRIDVITALKSMTIYGAKLNFDEENAGSIEVGKRADFAILDADPTKIASEKIKDINVTTTIIDGEVVYRKGAVVPVIS